MQVTVWLNDGPPIEIDGPDLEKPDRAFELIKLYINTQNSHLSLNFRVDVRL